MATVSESLTDGFVGEASTTWTFAIPAEVVVKVALALFATTGTVMELETPPFQVPIDDAKVTWVVGAGAVTVTTKESPVFIEVAEKLLVAVEVKAVAFKFSPVIPKLADAACTVIPAEAVVPNAEATNDADPEPPAFPVTVTANFPFMSVLPDAGVNEILPTPVLDRVIGVEGTAIPAALSAVKVIVAGEVPLSGTMMPLIGLEVRVEPIA